MARRTVGGFTYEYLYDGEGRLITYTDSQDSANNASYNYDFAGRRVRMQVGNRVTRFVYDGENVAVELVDEDNDGDIDFKRYYWILPQIDQYVGFADFDEFGKPICYYYLSDQVGSIVAVVDADGDIVCRYDYDAFGNLNETASFDNLTVTNRYRFQGREWDEHRGE